MPVSFPLRDGEDDPNPNNDPFYAYFHGMAGSYEIHARDPQNDQVAASDYPKDQTIGIDDTVRMLNEWGKLKDRAAQIASRLKWQLGGDDIKLGERVDIYKRHDGTFNLSVSHISQEAMALVAAILNQDKPINLAIDNKTVICCPYCSGTAIGLASENPHAHIARTGKRGSFGPQESPYKPVQRCADCGAEFVLLEGSYRD